MGTFDNWAPPLSLAATYGISVDFFSCRYLDVSVPCVRLITLCIQIMITDCSAGFSHSDIFGSMLVCQLPEAFRRLLRPSSPLTAKASTVCASLLDHIISITSKLYAHTNKKYEFACVTSILPNF